MKCSSCSRLAIAILLLLASVTHAQDPAESEAQVRDRFQAGFQEIVDDLNSGSLNRLAASIDQREFHGRVLDLRLIDPRVKKGYREQANLDFKRLIASGFDVVGGETRARLLGVESRGNRGRAVVRFDLPDFQFDYHEYELRLNDDGGVAVLDWLDFDWGESFTQSLGLSLVVSMPNKQAVRKLVDFPLSRDNDIFQLAEACKAIRDRKPDRYFEILENFDERMKRQRFVVLSSVQLTKMAKNRRKMRTALQTMAEYYPDDPMFSLMLLDYYFPARRYEEALRSLLSLQQRLGFEDAAMDARLSAAALVMGNTQDAAAYADRALELESGLELAWWSALRARTAGADFAGAVVALKQLEGQFGYDLDPEDFKKDRSFNDLIASTEYRDWLASH
jgi:tetratricopeptide (TPR) repeat protein